MSFFGKGGLFTGFRVGTRVYFVILNSDSIDYVTTMQADEGEIIMYN